MNKDEMIKYLVENLAEWPVHARRKLNIDGWKWMWCNDHHEVIFIEPHKGVIGSSIRRFEWESAKTGIKQHATKCSPPAPEPDSYVSIEEALEYSSNSIRQDKIESLAG